MWLLPIGSAGTRLSLPERRHNAHCGRALIKTDAPLFLYQPKNSAFGQNIRAPKVAGNPPRPLISDERNGMFDPRPHFIRERQKIGDGAEVNVGRVIPGMAERPRHRHTTGKKQRQPDAPMPKVWKRNDHVLSDAQQLMQHDARLACRLDGL